MCATQYAQHMSYVVKKIKKGKPYYYEYESYREDGKVKHRMVRYLGKTKDLARPRESEICQIRYWGNIQALFSVASELQFSNIINRYIQKGGGVEPSKLMFILAANRLLDPCSKRKLMKWYTRTALDDIIGVDAEQLSCQNLCSFLDYLQPKKIEKIENSFVKVLQEKYNASIDYIIYDITSTYTFGSINGLSERGYSRDHRGDLEQINIGLAVTEKEHFPIMHQIYEGNVPDIVTLPGTAHKLNKSKITKGFPRITLIHDRGFLSDSNIKVLDSLERFDFVCGAKRNSEIYNIIDDAIDRDDFVIIKDDDEEKKKRGTSFEHRLYGKNRMVVVVHSPILEKSRKERRLKKIEQAKESLNDLQISCKDRNKSHDTLVVTLHETLTGVKRFIDVTITDHPECNAIDVVHKEVLKIDKRKLTWSDKRLEKLISELSNSELPNRYIRARINECLGDQRKYYSVKIQKAKPHSTFEYSINEDAREMAEHYDGYYVLISSNVDHSMMDIISLYDEKDGVEKAFFTIKHPIKINPIRHWNPQRVRGHVFVCVIAYLLYSVMKFKLRSNGILTNVIEVLDDLGDIKQYQKKYVGSDLKERYLTAISKEQRELLSILGFEM
jgi:transposase